MFWMDRTLRKDMACLGTHTLCGNFFWNNRRKFRKKIIGTNFTDDVTILHVTFLLQRSPSAPSGRAARSDIEWSHRFYWAMYTVWTAIFRNQRLTFPSVDLHQNLRCFIIYLLIYLVALQQCRQGTLAWENKRKRRTVERQHHRCGAAHVNLRVRWGVTVSTRAYNMKSAGNISIEDHFEVILGKAQNLSTDGEEWLWNVNRRHGVPQQHYSVQIYCSSQHTFHFVHAYAITINIISHAHNLISHTHKLSRPGHQLDPSYASAGTARLVASTVQRGGDMDGPTCSSISTRTIQSRGESSNVQETDSWTYISSRFNKLRAPRPSNLGWKWHVHFNPPPVGKKWSHLTMQLQTFSQFLCFMQVYFGLWVE